MAWVLRPAPRHSPAEKIGITSKSIGGIYENIHRAFQDQDG
jgi:hypothetical protein